MNHPKTTLLSFVASLCFAILPCPAQLVRPDDVAVAWCLLVPGNSDAADRLLKLLSDQEIRVVSSVYDGCTLMSVYDTCTLAVSSRDAERAREIIARAIREEKLPATFLGAQARNSAPIR